MLRTTDRQTDCLENPTTPTDKVFLFRPGIINRISVASTRFS